MCRFYFLVLRYVFHVVSGALVSPLSAIALVLGSALVGGEIFRGVEYGEFVITGERGGDIEASIHHTLAIR